jgi:hypothetical protein
MTDPEPPAVPTEKLEAAGWTRSEERVETLFELPTSQIAGHTVVYENPTLGDETTTMDDLSRFFFATRLAFTPPLAPGTEPMVKPMVISNAVDSFPNRLQERGFTDITREQRERVRVETGERATLQAYHATLPRDGHSIPIEGWLGAWAHDGFRVAGGAYPRACDPLPGGADPSALRDELLDLLRAVA